MLNGFTFTVAAPDSAYTSFERAYWLSIGVQTQWGFLSGSGSSDFTWTYPQSFTSSVYSIQLAMRSGGSATASYNAFKTTSYSLTKWQGYMSLKEDVSFFLLAIGRQMQWGLAKIQPPGSVVNLNISCDIYCISATSIDGDWPYIKLIDNTKFKLVVNAQKAFWICLGIADKQQWGLETSASEVVTYPIPVSRVLCLLLTTKAIAFRYSPWPTEITVKSFRGMSDCEPAYWFLVAKQQWGTISHSEWVVTTFTYPITMRKVYAAVLAREDAANNKTEYTVTLISKNRTSLQFNGWSGDANVIVIGS